MKRFFSVAGLAVLASAGAAYAVEPSAVAQLVQSCCDALAACCGGSAPCCP